VSSRCSLQQVKPVSTRSVRVAIQGVVYVCRVSFGFPGTGSKVQKFLTILSRHSVPRARRRLVGKLGLKGQEEKPSFGFVGEEKPYYSMTNGQKGKTE
jgi:hypothetical protein